MHNPPIHARRQQTRTRWLCLVVLVMVGPAWGEESASRPDHDRLVTRKSFHPTVDTRVLMRQVNLDRLETIQRLIEGPSDWGKLRNQAELLAETSNLLLLRSPDHPYAYRWPYYVDAFRAQSNRLAKIAQAQDRGRAREALVGLGRSCNRCHAAFGVDVEITLADTERQVKVAQSPATRPRGTDDRNSIARAEPNLVPIPVPSRQGVGGDPQNDEALDDNTRPTVHVAPKFVPLPTSPPQPAPSAGRSARLPDSPSAALPGEVQPSSFESVMDETDGSLRPPPSPERPLSLVPMPGPSPTEPKADPQPTPPDPRLSRPSSPKPVVPQASAATIGEVPPAPVPSPHNLASTGQSKSAEPAQNTGTPKLDNHLPSDIPQPQPRPLGRAGTSLRPLDGDGLPPNPPPPPPESDPDDSRIAPKH